MKKICILVMVLLIGSLFAESGYRYSIQIEAIGDTSHTQALFDQISAGANNLFTDAHVQFIPKYETDKQNDWVFVVSGVLPVKKQKDTVTFTGTGRVNLFMLNANVPIIIGAEDTMSVVLSEWVNTYGSILRDNFITVRATNDTLVFESIVSGDAYDSPTITPVNGDLAGEVVTINAILPDVSNIDMLIYKYFYGISGVRDAEVSHNRDFH